jgi:hypothetical protein
VNLVNLYTDQVFFPFFAMSVLVLAALCGRRRSHMLAFATGVGFYAAMFCTFGLLALLPLLAAACAAGRHCEQHEAATLRAVLGLGICMTLGAAAAAVVSRCVLGYDVVVRYQHAMAHHMWWKQWTPGLATIARSAAVNAVDFTTWLGMPMTALAVGHALRSLAKLRHGRLGPGAIISVGLACVIALLLLFSKTKGEVGRLWLFLVPTVCILAADELAEMSHDYASKAAGLTIVMQSVTVYLIKVDQDFF